MLCEGLMQKKVQIISDGSQDLSPELSKEKDIEVVPFYVSFDGEHYYKEIEDGGSSECVPEDIHAVCTGFL